MVEREWPLFGVYLHGANGVPNPSLSAAVHARGSAFLDSVAKLFGVRRHLRRIQHLVSTMRHRLGVLALASGRRLTGCNATAGVVRAGVAVAPCTAPPCFARCASTHTLPGPDPAVFALALDELQHGRVHTCIAMLRDVLRDVPQQGLEPATEAMVRVNLGVSLQVAGDLDGAMGEFQSALALEPGMVQAHTALASAAQLDRQYGTAAAHYLAALELDPHNKPALVGAAVLHASASAKDDFPRRDELAGVLAGMDESMLAAEEGDVRWPVGVQLRTEAWRSQVDSVLAQAAQAQEAAKEGVACKLKTHGGDDLTYGRAVTVSPDVVTDDADMLLRYPDDSQPPLPFVDGAHPVPSVGVEGSKVMLDIFSEEAGIITEFLLPTWAQVQLQGESIAVARMVPATHRPSPPTQAPQASPPPTPATVVSVDDAADALAGATRIVALTGAGVSSASGLRTRKEMWATRSREDHVGVWRVTDVGGWGPLWDVTRALYDGAIGAPARPLPNAAHTALAELEASGRLQAVVSQNVDGLHQAAGSRTVLELHGTLERSHCDTCGKQHGPCWDLLRADKGEGGWPPACSDADCGGAVRPSVVLFGEIVPIDVLQGAAEQMMAADAVIVAGTAADGMHATWFVLVTAAPLTSCVCGCVAVCVCVCVWLCVAVCVAVCGAASVAGHGSGAPRSTLWRDCRRDQAYRLAAHPVRRATPSSARPS